MQQMFLYIMHVCDYVLGATKFSSKAVEAVPKNANSKDDNLVFVAGATGKVGSRTVRLHSIVTTFTIE